MPRVTLYGKPGCGICSAAEQKMQAMGLDYSKEDIAKYLDLHDGWKDDGSPAISAAYFMLDQRLPIFKIGTEFMSYPKAMAFLKGRTKQ